MARFMAPLSYAIEIGTAHDRRDGRWTSKTTVAWATRMTVTGPTSALRAPINGESLRWVNVGSRSAIPRRSPLLFNRRLDVGSVTASGDWPGEHQRLSSIAEFSAVDSSLRNPHSRKHSPCP
jgi:hypothetical protein